jgi:large conductance mechanosensitive channel
VGLALVFCRVAARAGIVTAMKILSEFREFAIKGNVVDLAIGLIIGAAFGAIVTSVVQDVMMPPLGWLTGGLDFKDKAIIIQKAGAKHPISGKVLDKDVVIAYGKFINAMITFLIQAIAVFMLVKVINRLRRQPPPADAPPPAPTEEQKLLGEIRDILRSRAA